MRSSPRPRAGRAGSSTCAETGGAGVPVDLVPYPMPARTSVTTRLLRRRGAAVVVPTRSDRRAAAGPSESLLDDDRRRRGWGGRRTLAPSAARALADELIAWPRAAAPVGRRMRPCRPTRGWRVASRRSTGSLTSVDIAIERDAPLGPLTTLRIGGRPTARPGARRASWSKCWTWRATRRSAGVLGKAATSWLPTPASGAWSSASRRRHWRSTERWCEPRPASRWRRVKRCTAAGLAGHRNSASASRAGVGGAVWANAGAHGGEIKDVVVTVDAGGPTATSRYPAESRLRLRVSRVTLKAGDEIVLDTVLQLTRGSRGDGGPRCEPQAQRRATQPWPIRTRECLS